MTAIVIDPGHGGFRVIGRSTPLGARGHMVCEKEITLDVAERIRQHAPDRVYLTRTDDRNLSLTDRAAIARAQQASIFLSIHAGGAATDAEAWIHHNSTAASGQLAARLADALGSREVYRGALSLLAPDAHAHDCVRCLIELGAFGRGNTTSEAHYRDPAFRAEVASALAHALTTDRMDIWHEVPLVQQLTGMSCWAAAAAMLVGWRDRIHVDAHDVARGAGQLAAYTDGLEPTNVETFARAWGLQLAHLRDVSVAELHRMLEGFGPLWVGEASPGLHVIVVAGMHGDGSVAGTYVRIADPWPVGRGARYTLSFKQFRENLVNAAQIAGGPPQVLHAPAGSRSRWPGR